jgi:hypothetical protein
MHRIIVILSPIEKESLQVFFFKARAIVANLRDLRNRIASAVALVNRDMLTRVWDEMGYRIDVCHIRKDRKLSICELCKKNLILSLFQYNKI